ncbi:DUF11 domain-containing protein [Streptomyces sp. SID8379]|uniref:DUF7927 domain-containing protein n=1 Tax=unclassified Streptomyces TaxID=2593676 RepID=UPI000360E558|nr:MULTISPECIES: DUF11 domain-containing protein [unclassified Streptomyces]MYW67944.1 DUF11 domain-containing protein [Streptomyces sp. SID8379]
MWLRQVQSTLAALAASAAAAATLVAAAVPASAVVVEPFAQRYDEAVYGDFLTLGNTVMQCPSTPADDAARCLAAQAGTTTENNNQFDMQYTDTAGFGTGVLNSSTGQVTIPPGATVAYARLFWGGNDGTYKLGNNQIARCDTAGLATSPTDSGPLDTRPLVRVGGGAETRATVQNAVRTPAAVGGPHYYTAESDITALFAGVTTGTPVPVAVGDIWAPTGKGCVGGWSLTVVYQYDGPNEQYAPTRRNVYIYGGHVVQQSKDPDTTIGIDGFYRAGNKDVRASVTAYEGDANVTGDAFLVNGTRISDPDSGGGTNNFFNSRAEGCLDPCEGNNFSIDAKTATIPSSVIPEGATSADLTFRTRGDTYVPSALAFSVPVPDLEVSKTASPKTVRPGDKVTYTVTAKNIGGVDYPGAKFADDLSDLLDDATYNNDASANIGTVTYDRPRLSWTGSVPEGRTATITYSVTVHDPVDGDGRLTNNVIADTPRTNCDDGSTDPSCGAAPTIEEPEPTPPLDVTVPDLPDNPKPGDLLVPVVIRNPASVPQETVVKDDDGTHHITVPPGGQVKVPLHFKVPNTPGEKVVRTLVIPNSVCAAGSTAPRCTLTFTVGRVQARPTPPQPRPHHPQGPELAETGTDTPTLLYGGLAVSLCGLGALILSAVRRHKD